MQQDTTRPLEATSPGNARMSVSFAQLPRACLDTQKSLPVRQLAVHTLINRVEVHRFSEKSNRGFKTKYHVFKLNCRKIKVKCAATNMFAK